MNLTKNQQMWGGIIILAVIVYFVFFRKKVTSSYKMAGGGKVNCNCRTSGLSSGAYDGQFQLGAGGTGSQCVSAECIGGA